MTGVTITKVERGTLVQIFAFPLTSLLSEYNCSLNQSLLLQYPVPMRMKESLPGHPRGLLFESPPELGGRPLGMAHPSRRETRPSEE